MTKRKCRNTGSNRDAQYLAACRQGERILGRLRESLSPHQADWPGAQVARWGFGEGLLNRDEVELVALFLYCEPEELTAPGDEPEPAFALSNPPARPKPWRAENEPTRQRMLLSGLDCLPGQGDLFATDGEGTG